MVMREYIYRIKMRGNKSVKKSMCTFWCLKTRRIRIGGGGKRAWAQSFEAEWVVNMAGEEDKATRGMCRT